MATIWEQCAEWKKCIHIPWPVNKDFCWTLRACIRIIEDAGTYKLEAEVNGLKHDWNLGNMCVDFPLPIPPFTVQICINNLHIGTIHKNVEFDLAVKACIDATVFGIHVQECIQLLNHHVSIHALTSEEVQSAGQLFAGFASEQLYATYSRVLTSEELAQSTKLMS